MDDWPLHILHAFDCLDLLIPSAEEFYEEFVQRWQGISEEQLIRAAREYDGGGLDRWFALLALGALPTPAAHETLLAFLESSDTEERVLSALGLARMGDHAALPTLLAYVEGFQPVQVPRETAPFANYWFTPVIRTLGQLGHPRAVPALRRALSVAVEIEQGASDSPPEVQEVDGERRLIHIGSRRDGWQEVQNTIVYALGRLGASGALTGLPRTQEYLDDWRIHLIMGSLHDKYRFRILDKAREAPELHADVEQLLERWFGLDEDERMRCMRAYEEHSLFNIPQPPWRK